MIDTSIKVIYHAMPLTELYMYLISLKGKGSSS